MADSYVTSGAKIKCSCGDKISTLTVYSDRTSFLTEKPVANVSDHTSMYNIAPFGKCHTTSFPPTGSATSANHGCLTPMPCVPGTHSKWQNGKNDYIIKGDAALLKSSYCRCCYGGIITVVDDGQVDTGEADLSRKSAETEEDWKEKEQEELLADKEALLDCLQTALDVAGFAPGVGAIADLTNAAIYAVRGDKINAGLSLLAAVPGIGDAAAAAKLAGKGVKVAKASKLAKNAKNANQSLRAIPSKPSGTSKIASIGQHKTSKVNQNGSNVIEFPQKRAKLRESSITKTKENNVVKINNYEVKEIKQVNGANQKVVTKKVDQTVASINSNNVNRVNPTTGSTSSYSNGGHSSYSSNRSTINKQQGNKTQQQRYEESLKRRQENAKKTAERFPNSQMAQEAYKDRMSENYLGIKK